MKRLPDRDALRKTLSGAACHRFEDADGVHRGRCRVCREGIRTLRALREVFRVTFCATLWRRSPSEILQRVLERDRSEARPALRSFACRRRQARRRAGSRRRPPRGPIGPVPDVGRLPEEEGEGGA